MNKKLLPFVLSLFLLVTIPLYALAIMEQTRIGTVITGHNPVVTRGQTTPPDGVDSFSFPSASPITATSGDRYIDPSAGSDSNDCLTLVTACQTVTKMNSIIASPPTSLRFLINAPTTHPLVVNTVLDVEGTGTAGTIITSADPAHLAWLISYTPISTGVMSQPNVGTYPHVWGAATSTPFSVIYEMGASGHPADLLLYHFCGNGNSTLTATSPTSSTIASCLESTVGSFWNDGNSIYFHPKDGLDPTRVGAPVYSRTYAYGVSGTGISATIDGDRNNPVEIRPDGGVTIDKLGLVGGIVTLPLVQDPIGAYNIRFTPGTGTTTFSNSYTTFGSKHNIAEVADCTRGNPSHLVITNTEGEYGTPYGGGTPYVFFGGSSGAPCADVTISFATSLHPIAPLWDDSGPTRGQAFLTHGAGGGMGPIFSFINVTHSNFDNNGVNNFGGSIAGPLHLTTTTLGNSQSICDDSGGVCVALLADRCLFKHGIATTVFVGGAMAYAVEHDINDSVIRPEAGTGGSDLPLHLIGRVKFEGCYFDDSLASSIMFYPQTGFGIASDGATSNQLWIHNSGGELDGNMINFFSNGSTALFNMDYNHWQCGGASCASYNFYVDPSGTISTFSQFQALTPPALNVYDLHSTTGLLVVDSLGRPRSGSPLIGTANPGTRVSFDYSGKFGTRVNKGAFEGTWP